MHFKMYKSGKNWMVAGLMTTAVLAGLTLGNVNATEAHADVNAPVAAAAQKTPATSAQISAASDNVVAKSAALSNANAALNSAQNDVAKAASANSNVAVIAQDSANVDSAFNAVTSASNVLSNATSATTKARRAHRAASQEAQRDGATASYVAHFNELAQNAAASAATASQAVASASAAMDAANATINSIKDQISALQKRIDNMYNQFLTAGGTDAMIANPATAPANLKGQLEVYKQLWAGKDSLDASLGHPSIPDSRHANNATGAYRTYEEAQYNYNVALNKLNYWKGQQAGNAKHAADKQKVLDKLNAAAAKLEAARTAESAAQTNFQNALTALNNAKSKLRADRDLYGVPTHDQVNAASATAQNDENWMKANANWAAYSAASAQAQTSQKHVDELTAARPAAVEALVNAKKTLADAQEALSKTTAGTAEAAAANEKVAEAQTAVDDAQADLDSLDSTLRAAQRNLKNAQDTMAAKLAANTSNGTLQQWVDKYNAAESAYQELLKEFNNNKNPMLAAAAAQNALTEAKANQAAAQEAYNKAVAYYNSLTGETPATPSHTVNPSGIDVQPGAQLPSNPSGHVAGSAATVSFVNGHVNAAAEGTTDGVTIVSSEWTNGYDAAQAQVAKAQAELKAANQASKVIYISATYKLSDGTTVVKDVPVTVLNNVNTNPDQPAQGNQGSNTENTNKGEAGFTGEKGGKYFVKGQQVSAAQYNAYVAAHKNAAKKSAAKAAAKKLPQTGNNSAAVVALGALSGMLGLGLAAKKREF